MQTNANCTANGTVTNTAIGSKTQWIERFGLSSIQVVIRINISDSIKLWLFEYYALNQALKIDEFNMGANGERCHLKPNR
jgi:hypothetical protein